MGVQEPFVNAGESRVGSALMRMDSVGHLRLLCRQFIQRANNRLTTVLDPRGLKHRVASETREFPMGALDHVTQSRRRAFPPFAIMAET
jgi:hypothetical protein